MLSYWKAAAYLQPLKVRKQYSINLPNKYNISFDIFFVFWAIMIIYPPGNFFTFF